MSPESRRAALRAAAKTALVAALGACGSDPKPAPQPPQNTTPIPVVEYKPGPNAIDVAAPCVAYLDTLAQAKPEQLAAGDPLRERHDIYGAFADAKLRAEPKTQSCCSEEMVAFGSSAKHRWACCSALGNKLPKDAAPSACTPWGPPCPPEMV